MRVKKVTALLLGFCLIFFFYGFNKSKKVSPEALGLFMAKIDDQGLRELIEDKVYEKQNIKNRINSSSKGFFKTNTAFPNNDGENEFILYSEDDPEQEKTLTKKAISDEFNIERLNRQVTTNKINRSLFSKPASGVLFSSVTVLDELPFFISRYVQIVTDPAWNRIVYGDYEGWIKSYGENNTNLEKLNRPHGIDRDVDGVIYVADTGNNRIVVLRLTGKGKNTLLKFQFSFGAGQLNQPYDVAWDDTGTPFDRSDDIIWVTDTGNNRVLGFSLQDETATQRYNFTSNGDDFFHNPKQIVTGKFNGASNNTLFVTDKENQRIIKLNIGQNEPEGNAIYNGKTESNFSSLAVDHWGNLYATDRNFNEVLKLTADLNLLTQKTGVDGPLNFHTIFGEIHLQSENKRIWAGYNQAFLMENWTENSGAQRFQLGVDLTNVSVSMDSSLERLYMNLKLTDHADLSLDLVEAESGNIITEISAGWLNPGSKKIAWDRVLENGKQVEPGYYKLSLSAKSGYENLNRDKLTDKFYLPLYYRDDCGADENHDPHLVQGMRSREWGNEPNLSIARHPSEVIYHFSKLNPGAEYELKANFHNKVGNDLWQKVLIDNISMTDEFEVPAGDSQLGWIQIPKGSFNDGEIDVSIIKALGEGDAMISELWLRKANYSPENVSFDTDNKEIVPEKFSLLQNYPNPFNSRTTIPFMVPEHSNQNTSLKIFNSLGQTVKTLIDKDLAAGKHSVTWDGNNLYGVAVSSGTYFYMLKSGNTVEVKKLLLLK